VPTAVDAGADRSWPAALTHAWHGTALPLLVVAAGALLVGAGLLRRRSGRGPIARS
jgi:hypothetical protein